MSVVFILCILIFHDSPYFVTRCNWQLDNKHFIIIIHFRSNRTSNYEDLPEKSDPCVPHFKVTGTDTDSSATYDFLLTFHSNHVHILYHFCDKVSQN